MSDLPNNKHPFVYSFAKKVEILEQGTLAMKWDGHDDPFKGSHPVPFNDALSTIQVYEGVLKPFECRQVIALGDAQPPITNTQTSTRDCSHSTWIEPSPETYWLFHKVGALFTYAADHFGFEVTGLMEPFLYSVYEEDQSFNWRADLGSGSSSTRKVSMILQLSANDEFIGGEMQFVNAPSHKGMGSATFYPSYLAHRLTPVILGVHRSLVAWGCGPTFR